MRLLRSLLVLLLLPVLAAPGWASQAARPKDKVVTFGLGPADARGVDGRPYFYYLGAGGTRLRDHVAVLNYSNTPLPLAVYATDGYNTFAGSSDLLPASKKPTDVGAWITLAAPQRTIVVPPRSNNRPGSVLLAFTLTIPPTAEPGDHVGGIVAALRTHSRNAKGFVVDLDQRVATQVFLRVAGALHPRLTVTDLKVRYHGTLNPFGTGWADVSYTVRNTGNVRLGGLPDVSASGLVGTWSAKGLPKIPPLVPGGSAHLHATVSGLWPEVFMKASVRIAATQLATDVDPPSRPARASARFWAIPWTLIALIVLLYLLWRRARRRRLPAPVPSSPPAPAAAVAAPVPPAPAMPAVTEPAIPPQPAAPTPVTPVLPPQAASAPAVPPVPTAPAVPPAPTPPPTPQPVRLPSLFPAEPEPAPEPEAPEPTPEPEAPEPTLGPEATEPAPELPAPPQDLSPPPPDDPDKEPTA